MRFFTIVAKNYLAYAITLGEELERHHPGSSFTIFLADKVVGLDFSDVPFEVVPLEDVGLIDELGMISRYNITELSTALKPFAFLHLFERSDDPVVYLDPDIFVLSPMSELVEHFESSEAILTPHIVRPVERAGLRSATFLRYGMYNLGFLGLLPSPQTESFLTWWAERLEVDCRIDSEEGLFVDQKWADFIPSFIEKTKVLHHEGYNVAYWNLHNRRVSKRSDGYFANEAPVRFVHFSAIPDEGEPALSKRYPVFTVQNSPAMGDLLTSYRQRLKESRSDFFSRLKFSYFLQPSDVENIHYPELAVVADSGILPRSPDTYVHSKTVRSEAEYNRFLELHRSTEIERRSQEDALVEAGRDSHVYLDGYDLFAQRFVTYSANVHQDSTDDPSASLRWMSELRAGGGYTSRIRSFVHLLCQELQPTNASRIAVSETLGSVHGLLAELGASVSVDGQFDATHGRTEGEFDLFLSFDVIKDKADIEATIDHAWTEVKPGGHLWISVSEPSLGWKLLEQLDRSPFQNAHALTFWSWHFGYLGPHQLLFSAHKPFEDERHSQDVRKHS